ncbi:hypothetical protein GMDG_07377 [Pseudogymnoascus destructans 20631-21]|uniref:Uncharacterized protein n=1 Tax=Pseudogymnoascus destructans (strain ATCC MYA-4855 / 20631-21) TaxID=658429 RepID=L8FXV0_PSED2|nr:hypothetical protein GMDG_07377 [Pseudogymnoascus destructans 20631-21]
MLASWVATVYNFRSCTVARKQTSLFRPKPRITTVVSIHCQMDVVRWCHVWSVLMWVKKPVPAAKFHALTTLSSLESPFTRLSDQEAHLTGRLCPTSYDHIRCHSASISPSAN